MLDISVSYTHLSSAAPTLMVMCVTVPLMALLQTTNGILQGVNRQALPMKNLAIGAVFKVAVTYAPVSYTPLDVYKRQRWTWYRNI